MKKVAVFGSFVVDLMARSPHLPVPGETVKGSMFKMGPGGKGFNQCVAAHKAEGIIISCRTGVIVYGNSYKLCICSHCRSNNIMDEHVTNV